LIKCTEHKYFLSHSNQPTLFSSSYIIKYEEEFKITTQGGQIHRTGVKQAQLNVFVERQKTYHIEAIIILETSKF